MWEMDMEGEEDSWSLIAIVKECARKVQCRVLGDQGAQNTTTATEATTVAVETDNNRLNPFSDDFGGGGDNSVQVGVSDKNSAELDNQQNPFFDELIESSFQIGVSDNNSAETDNNQLIPFLYQLVSSDNNLAQIGVSDNNSVENPITLDQNDASYNISSQNPSTFSDQIDAGNNNFLQIPPPFSIQNDASKNYSLQNPSPFSNQVDASKNYALQNPSPFSNQVDASNNNFLQNPIQNYARNYSLQNPSPFSIQNVARNNSLQNPSPFFNQVNASTNSLQNPSPFFNQVNASSNSLQNPSQFSNQVNATSNSLQNRSPFFNQVNASRNSLQNPSPCFNQVNASSSSLQNPSPFFNQVNASSNSLQNPSPFFNQVNASSNSLQSPSPVYNQVNASNNNSLQNPSPFSNQVVASNNNSLQTPTPFSNQKDASTRDWAVPLPRTRGRSSCGHHFMDLFPPLLMAPQNNPNPIPIPNNQNHNSTKEVHPLQDFNAVPNFTPNTQRDPGLYRFPQRKRKFESNRRVYRVTLEELSKNDKWAWRKYGQKPIKGSPYPRNYYKCSSCKECMAKKQVERSPIEPETYLVTYTGEHLHPRPAYRTHGGHRVRKSVRVVDSSEEENNASPTSTMATHGSGSLSGSGDNVVIVREGTEDGAAGVGAGGGADDCGDSEEKNNYDDFLIPNPMADINFENADGYGYRYGNETEKIECDRDVNKGVQEEGTSGGCNI